MGYIAPNKENYKVLTPSGFKDFSGVSFMGDEEVIRLDFEDNLWLECTIDHKIFQSFDSLPIEVSKLNIGDCIITSLGYKKLLNKTSKGILPIFDLVEVQDGHRFYANNVLVSNCEFLIFSETLVNASKLLELEGIEPIERHGQVRWYKTPSKGHVYLVGLDPSMGTGGDNAAIEIFELPSMTQVGEWMHNKTPIPQQIKILKEICEYLSELTQSNKDVYYSVENNSLGEAALISISELGEENIPGTFLSEGKRKGNTRTFRRGFNTTENSKISACAKFKSLLETGRLIVYSKALISELKTFEASGRSYSAKTGETDDLVMATILIVRMAMALRQYDPLLETHLRDHLDKIREPMPFVLVM